MADTAKALPPLPGANKGNLLDLYERFRDEPALADGPAAFDLQLLRYGARVRAARKARGWTQTDLARRSGLKQARISEIEAGTMTDGPTFRTMARLAGALEARSLTALSPAPTLALDPAVLGEARPVIERIVAQVNTVMHRLATGVAGAGAIGTALAHGAPPMIGVRKLAPEGAAAGPDISGYEVVAMTGPEDWSGQPYVTVDGIVEPLQGGDRAEIDAANRTRTLLVMPEDGDQPAEILNYRTSDA